MLVTKLGLLKIPPLKNRWRQVSTSLDHITFATCSHHPEKLPGSIWTLYAATSYFVSIFRLVLQQLEQFSMSLTDVSAKKTQQPAKTQDSKQNMRTEAIKICYNPEQARGIGDYWSYFVKNNYGFTEGFHTCIWPISLPDVPCFRNGKCWHSIHDNVIVMAGSMHTRAGPKTS